MNSGSSFLKTLKRVGYLEADCLDPSDFDSLFSEKDLKGFFDVFCMLDEKNVLTTEEIEEYSALTASELAEIEALDKNRSCEKSDFEHEKKKEILFLQEHLAHVENHNKTIERQIESFKKHEEDLLEEKETYQNLLINAKKRFQTYEMSKIAQVEEEFVSSLKSILEVAQDLEMMIVHTDATSDKLPSSNFFKDIVQKYLDIEVKVLQCVNSYLENNFQLDENKNLPLITNENAHRKEFSKEASFLKKTLKSNMNDKVVSEKELEKLKTMVKKCETIKNPCVNGHFSQLRCKLDDAMQLNELLKKKEKELESAVYAANAKHVDALLTEIDLSLTHETCNDLKFFIEKMSLPMTMLIHQRARLEMLLSSLAEHTEELQNLKRLILKVLSYIKEEQAYLRDQKALFEDEQLVDVTQDEDKLCFDTILSSLNKILAVSGEFESSASIEEVVQKVSKLSEAKENLKKKCEEKIKTIDSMEKYAQSMESLLHCEDKEFLYWHEMQQNMNTNLNNLKMKLSCLEKNIAECSQDLEQKQKILERKRNLQLARNLYVYGLMNMELFKKYIDDIKVALENSAGYAS